MSKKSDITEQKQDKRKSMPQLFKPGQSGNPAGRPKGSVSITTEIKKRLEEMSPDGQRTALQVLVENIIQDALDNNNEMRKLIWNYVDGQPSQKVEQSGGTINLNIELSDEQFQRLIRERAEQLNSPEGS